MSFLLDLTIDHPHFPPPARRTNGAGNIKWTDEMLAFGRHENGKSFMTAFGKYQKSFAPKKKKRARANAG